MTTLPARRRQVFHHQDEPLEFVYFPNGGVASITEELASGLSIEVATIGREGMIGIEAFFGPRAISQGNAFLQVPDTSVQRLSVTVFRRELARGGALQLTMGRYAQALLAQMMMSSVCNALHPVHQRCARWILMTHDRMLPENLFQLSHEFLAIMLGVQRQTVTVVAGGLQRAGLIRYVHGKMRVLDRRGLEGATCECYATLREKIRRIDRA